MTVKIPSTGLNAPDSCIFSHSELRQVLAAYGEGVLHKNWKDYAIHTDKGQTTFCVIERGQGLPAAVIYSISRTRSRKNNGRDYYRVFDGEKQIHRGENFMEALSAFREAGYIQPKKGRKFNLVR